MENNARHLNYKGIFNIRTIYRQKLAVFVEITPFLYLGIVKYVAVLYYWPPFFWRKLGIEMASSL